MYGGLICYATKCTEGLSVAEFWGGLALAFGIVALIGLVGYFITRNMR